MISRENYWGIIFCLVTIIVFLESKSAAAQEPIDWREELICNAEQQAYEGLLYCTGTDETGKIVHVLIADLQSHNLRFEYMIPKGLNDHDSLNAAQEPCNDVNVPSWGGTFGQGCFQPGTPNLFPVMSLQQAVERAKEIRNDKPLAAIINADYSAPDQTHGPEGLTVIQGLRLDGAKNCDDDFNATLRPWLGLGENTESSTGQLPATIQRLTNDSQALPDWLYTGIGGGPWLIRDGEVVSGSDNCKGEKTLTQLDQIENCYLNPKTKNPPLLETYNSGSCRAAPHTAAGLSEDGRWLFLVLTTSSRTPGTITRFMHDKLGVWQALKFDGGGSSQLIYFSPQPVEIDPSDENRPLTNFLALYTENGRGIHLPLEAKPIEQVAYQVITGQETANFQLQMRNTGSLTWKPEDGIILREEPWFLITPVVEELPLTEPITPGEIATWPWKINTDRFVIRRFQMYQRNVPFGPELAVIVIHLPDEWKEREVEFERKIQQLIDAWKARGEKELDQLLTEIQEWLTRELGRWLARLLARIQQIIIKFIQETCLAPLMLGSALMMLSFKVKRRCKDR